MCAIVTTPHGSSRAAPTSEVAAPAKSQGNIPTKAVELDLGLTNTVVKDGSIRVQVSDARALSYVKSLIKRPTVRKTTGKKAPGLGRKQSDAASDRDAQKRRHLKYAGMVGQSDELIKLLSGQQGTDSRDDLIERRMSGKIKYRIA